jgi:hypothetical protein
MAKTYYVWSPIHYYDTSGDVPKLKILKPGNEVTRELIGESDEGWALMLEGGSIRTERWPEGLNPDNANALSPNEYRLRQLRLEREGVEAEIAGVGASSSAEEEPAVKQTPSPAKV